MWIAVNILGFGDCQVWEKEYCLQILISFIHLAVSLTTGPKSLLKQAVHILPRASSFGCEYSLLSLTLSLLMSYIYINIWSSYKARNLTSYIYGWDLLLGILPLEPCISLIYAWKTNKYISYSISLLIMYGKSYMFPHYIAIFRERS
jgi:hypothetical protein